MVPREGAPVRLVNGAIESDPAEAESAEYKSTNWKNAYSRFTRKFNSQKFRSLKPELVEAHGSLILYNYLQLVEAHGALRASIINYNNLA